MSKFKNVNSESVFAENAKQKTYLFQQFISLFAQLPGNGMPEQLRVENV